MSEKHLSRRELFQKAAAFGALGVAGTSLSCANEEQAATIAAAGETADAFEKVPQRPLGATGENIPILLLGAGEGFDPVYDKILHAALKDGAYYIDGAESYAGGQSHVSIGNFHEQIGDRKKIWITSKVALSPGAATPELYASRMEAFLPTLKTDYLDMFFMHEVRTLRVLEPEFIRMGENLKNQGKTKFFGFSCHGGNVVELMNKAAEIGAPGIDAIMFRYNFTKYGDLELNNAIDNCKNAGIGLIAMKTQSSVPADQKEVKEFQSKNFTLGQAKLKAVWADERIDSAVSHMTNLDLYRENAAAAKSPVQLSMDEFMQLNRYAVRTAAERCQGCDRICETQVAGDLRIADTLRYLMYAECYGRTDEAKKQYRALTPTQRDHLKVDLAQAQADCPQNINLAERLNRAQELLA